MNRLIYAGPDNIRPNRDRKDCKIVKETIINTCISKKLRKFLNDHCSIVIAYESSYYNTVVYKISEVIKIQKHLEILNG